jgi:putative tryptophan/tyrosine transport system substrate-binding protein
VTSEMGQRAASRGAKGFRDISPQGQTAPTAVGYPRRQLTGSRMRRREFIAGLGSAAAWPSVARAQQGMTPVIGYISPQSFDVDTGNLRAFRQGLKDTGYVEGENVAVEYRFAENQVDRLSALAAELVRRQVAIIIAASGPTTVVVAKATTTIPVVFIVPEDPVRLGLVKSLARPGGNMTGVNIFLAELAAKRLALLREFLPAAVRIAVLINPAEAAIAETTLREVELAASALGLQVRILKASTIGEINAAFATIARERPDALFMSSSPFFAARRVQLAILASHHAIPAISAGRTFVEAGGLMSYGTNSTDWYRQVGVYAGRILEGVKPADLPVVQSTKFEFVINLQTANALGLTIPETLLATADEVIQ